LYILSYLKLCTVTKNVFGDKKYLTIHIDYDIIKV